MAWSNAPTCPRCLYGPYIIVIVLSARIAVRFQCWKTACHFVRITDLGFLKQTFWQWSIALEMFSRFHCCIGEDAGSNIRWVKARGQVSPWDPDGSAAETAPASDARFLIQTSRISASDPENASSCIRQGEYDRKCCAASSDGFSWSDRCSNPIAKSISMEK